MCYLLWITQAVFLILRILDASVFNGFSNVLENFTAQVHIWHWYVLWSPIIVWIVICAIRATRYVIWHKRVYGTFDPDKRDYLYSWRKGQNKGR